METILDEDNFIGEPEHLTDTVGYKVGNATIFCTIDEMYYLKKLHRTYKSYLKAHPNEIDDMDEVWEYMEKNLPFKKKHLTQRIMDLFRGNMEAFSKM